MSLTLLVTPDGRCALADPDMTVQQASDIRRALAKWSRGNPLLIAADVVRVETIELDIGETEGPPRPKRTVAKT